MRWILLLSLVVPFLAGCGATATQGAGPVVPNLSMRPETSPGETTVDSGTPVTSAGGASQPVPFVWTTHQSHRPGGSSLILHGGTIHALPGSVRLLDPRGQVVATGDTVPIRPPVDPCPGEVGIVRAELPLNEEMLVLFLDGWPSGYRVEVLVGWGWRPAETTFAGCRSTEARDARGGA